MRTAGADLRGGRAPAVEGRGLSCWLGTVFYAFGWLKVQGACSESKGSSYGCRPCSSALGPPLIAFMGA